jgi:hypothetical protein
VTDRRPSMVRSGLVAALVLALVASTLVLGEPSRPATATIVRPIVTVQAFCTVPTVVDVAAGEAPRGLAAVGELLGLDDDVAGEQARQVDIVETEAGTFFVHLDGRQLRYAAIGTSGLPVLSPTGPDSSPRTYRVVQLDSSLVAAGRPLVTAGPDGAVALFSSATEPTAALSLTTESLTAPTGEVTIARLAEGPRQDGLRAAPGRVGYHAGVLWLTGDDGSLWSYDPAVAGSDAWSRLATGVQGNLLARGEGAVHVVVRDDDGAAVRSFGSAGSQPTVRRLDDPSIRVEAATFPASTTAAFLVRSADADGFGLLRPERAAAGDGPDVVWSVGPHTDDPVVGLTATSTAVATVIAAGAALRYDVLDDVADHAGSFTSDAAEQDCVGSPDRSDAATVVTPTGAGSLLHLHDPAGRFDCIVDGRDGIEDVDARCAPGGAWSLDKGAAPPTGFTVEITRALEEFLAEQAEQEGDASDDDLTDDEELGDDGGSALQDEFEDVGLGVVEVDEVDALGGGDEGDAGLAEVDAELAETCAEEEVVTVAPPTLDSAEAVGDAAISVAWRWDGGLCLPDRYVVSTCVVTSDGGDCTDRTDTEVVDRDGGSNRFVTEVRARPDRTYRVTVIASKRGVVSGPSSAVVVRTPPTVPAPPRDVRASLRDGAWTISWASCLDDGSCEQRPDGFVVVVEGCEGDSLSGRDSLGASQRSVTYDVRGSGFPGADLLGRRVVFRVAATAAGTTSERVSAGACTETTRPGRDATLGDAGISLALSGRTTSMTLQGPDRSAALTRLFGTASYDDVSARLVRSGAQTSSRSGALGGSVSFEVDRCQLRGWTVELTPRRGGSELTRHRSRISGVPAACGWAVTDETRPSVTVSRDGSTGFVASVRLPGLSEDVANDKVAGASASTTCRIALGSERTTELSGGSIDGDSIRFTGAAPAVFDVANGCTLRVRLQGTGQETIAPRSVALDLTPVRSAVLAAVAPRIDAAVFDAGFTRDFPDNRFQRNARVVLRFPGVDCGSSAWTVSLTPRRSGSEFAPCDGRARTVELREGDLDGAHGELRLRIRVGSDETESSRRVRACEPGDDRRPCRDVDECPHPWAPGVPTDDPTCTDPCPWDPSVPETDRSCFEPCPWDAGIPIGDPACVEPPGPCEWDPGLPADHPDCVEPVCEWDPALPPDDPACRPPDEGGDPDPDP